MTFISILSKCSGILNKFGDFKPLLYFALHKLFVLTVSLMISMNYSCFILKETALLHGRFDNLQSRPNMKLVIVFIVNSICTSRVACNVTDNSFFASNNAGTFCGMGKFPYSIIGTSEDLFVEFVSSVAGPLLNTGFHFNVGNWPGHVETAGSRNGTCDWLLTSEDLAVSGDSEGIFLSVAHWYPPHTSCTYLMQGQKDEIVRLYFPR